MKPIHYVAAFFFNVDGERLKKEARHFFLKHISTLKNEKIANATFVVNSNFPQKDKPTLDQVIAEFSENFPVKLIVRQNQGYSYGAWEYALGEVGIDPNFDYFLIEGDYVPNKGFLSPFQDAMTPESCFIAQKIDAIPGSAPVHAAISNGLLSGVWAKEAENAFARVFAIYPFTLNRGDHLMGCENQVTFLQFLVECGGQLSEISREYSIPFFETTLNKTIEHGTRGAFAPLTPIQEM